MSRRRVVEKQIAAGRREGFQPVRVLRLDDVALSLPCPACEAREGQDCIGPEGQEEPLHMPRLKDAENAIAGNAVERFWRRS